MVAVKTEDSVLKKGLVDIIPKNETHGHGQ